MKNPWQKSTIGNLEIKNRFVRSATFEALGNENGFCSEKIYPFYHRLASGGAGLIISGHLFVDPAGRASALQPAIDDDRYIDALTQIPAACHDKDSKIFAQISHAGAHADCPDGFIPKGPSAITFDEKRQCAEMTQTDIDHTIEQFGKAALRAQQAGFDGLQIHAAHGYLISQFLSPWYNKRQDQYGGSVEKRALFLLQILEKIRKNVGHDYPVIIKINGDDYLGDGIGLSSQEALVTVKMAEHLIDGVEISGGCAISDRKLTPVRSVKADSIDDVYHIASAKLFRDKLNIPTILVGGIASLDVSAQLIDNRTAQFIALSRPFICEPDLINKWQTGISQNSACVRCTKCFKTLKSGDGVYCAVKQSLPQ